MELMERVPVWRPGGHKFHLCRCRRWRILVGYLDVDDLDDDDFICDDD